MKAPNDFKLVSKPAELFIDPCSVCILHEPFRFRCYSSIDCGGSYFELVHKITGESVDPKELVSHVKDYTK